MAGRVVEVSVVVAGQPAVVPGPVGVQVVEGDAVQTNGTTSVPIFERTFNRF